MSCPEESCPGLYSYCKPRSPCLFVQGKPDQSVSCPHQVPDERRALGHYCTALVRYSHILAATRQAGPPTGPPSAVRHARHDTGCATPNFPKEHPSCFSRRVSETSLGPKRDFPARPRPAAALPPYPRRHVRRPHLLPPQLETKVRLAWPASS